MQKKHNSIGCCGIDCGLCPRFISKSDSACPGCGGVDFKEKHPACGFLSCCANKSRLEVCSLCTDYPCRRFDSEKDGYDSFVSHKKVFENLSFIKNNGIDLFIENQKLRVNILTDFIEKFDDGRSKSFFCLSCTLLPIDELTEVHANFAKTSNPENTKDTNKKLRDALTELAEYRGIKLKLNKK